MPDLLCCTHRTLRAGRGCAGLSARRWAAPKATPGTTPLARHWTRATYARLAGACRAVPADARRPAGPPHPPRRRHDGAARLVGLSDRAPVWQPGLGPGAAQGCVVGALV